MACNQTDGDQCFLNGEGRSKIQHVSILILKKET